MRLTAIYNATLLSKYRSIGNCTFTYPFNKVKSTTVWAMDLYSSSIELLEIVFCFLAFQYMRDVPNLIQKSETDLINIGQEA